MSARMEAILNFGRGSSIRITQGKLLGQTMSYVLFDKRDPKSALAETLRWSKNGFPGKLGKETIAGVKEAKIGSTL